MASGGALNRAFTWNAPTFGPTAILTSSMGGPATATGHYGVILDRSRLLISDFAATVALQSWRHTLRRPAVLGRPLVADVYASATLVGIIPP